MYATTINFIGHKNKFRTSYFWDKLTEQIDALIIKSVYLVLSEGAARGDVWALLTPGAPVCWTVVLMKLQQLQGSVSFTVWHAIWFGPIHCYTLTEKTANVERQNG